MFTEKEIKRIKKGVRANLERINPTVDQTYFEIETIKYDDIEGEDYNMFTFICRAGVGDTINCHFKFNGDTEITDVHGLIATLSYLIDAKINNYDLIEED